VILLDELVGFALLIMVTVQSWRLFCHCSEASPLDRSKFRIYRNLLVIHTSILICILLFSLYRVMNKMSLLKEEVDDTNLFRTAQSLSILKTCKAMAIRFCTLESICRFSNASPWTFFVSKRKRTINNALCFATNSGRRSYGKHVLINAPSTRGMIIMPTVTFSMLALMFLQVPFWN
jgi:hypothetical protein